MAKKTNRRKKNAAERLWDQKDLLEVYSNFYNAAARFYAELECYEGNYGEVGIAYYDSMHKAFNMAGWMTNKAKEDYVAENLEGHYETTTHKSAYENRTEGG